MKTVWALFLAAVLVCPSSYAQTAHRRLPDDGDGPTTPPAPGELFVGEWEWSSGGEVFHISLVRDPAYVSPRFPEAGVSNVVIGQYSFTRNGVLIDQSPATGPHPYALFCVPADNKSMHMSFKDHAKNKYAKAILTLVPSQLNTLTWKIEPVEKMYFDGDVMPPPGYTVPTDVTLTRQ